MSACLSALAPQTQLSQLIGRYSQIVEDSCQCFRTKGTSCVHRDHDPCSVSRASEDGMASFLTIEFETELARYSRQILRLDDWEARAHTPTSTGRITRSSAGTGSP